MQQAEATGDAQQCSSYGTGDSEDERAIDPTEMEATGGMVVGMKAKTVGTGLIEATQMDIMKKLDSMGKAIATMQVDMNWVREDMRVVHEVVDKVADRVCELTDVTAEVGKLQQPTCVSPSVWGTWGVGTGVEEQERAIVEMTAADDGGIRHDEGTTHIPAAHEDVCSVWESQPVYSNVEKNANISSSAEEGEAADWYSDHDELQGLCSPPRKQTRTNDVVDSQDEETQQMDMACQNTQASAPAYLRSMWADFRTTAKELRASPPPGAPRQEGWVSTKRVRGSFTNSDEVQTEVRDAEPHEHAALNLNLPPDKHVSPAAMLAGGSIHTASNTAGTSRGGPREREGALAKEDARPSWHHGTTHR